MNSPNFTQKSQNFPKFKTNINFSNPKSQLSSSNAQYIFNFPQKVFIKNQFINIPNSKENNVDYFHSLDFLLKKYSKSLSPNPYILTVKTQPKQKSNKRNKSNNIFNRSNISMKNATFFDDNNKFSDENLQVFDENNTFYEKNKNYQRNQIFRKSKMQNFRSENQKNHNYLDILFDDSLISLRDHIVKDGEFFKAQRIKSLSPFSHNKSEDSNTPLKKPFSKSYIHLNKEIIFIR